MKIVIDCFKLVKGVGKSIGIYNLTVNLVKNLIIYKPTMQNEKIRTTELIIIGNKYNQKDFKFPGVKFVCINKLNPLCRIHCVIWELFIVSQFCKKINADKIVFPRGFCALTHPVEDIIIIHDLIPFYYDVNFPKVFNKLENKYIMNRLIASAKSCNHVITVSEASKYDILKYCNIKEEKITVIHNGCNKILFDGEKCLLNEPYICAITSDLPHKNAKGIMKAYMEYCTIASNPIRLIIIGIESIACLGLKDIAESKVTCYKFIKDDIEMYRVIANSTVFLFLSLVEGFGFPPIEAMQLNVPVICSNCSSLPEIVGDAAMLVDPENSNEVAYALDALINNQEERNKLIEKGKKNVERFSWNSRAKLYWNTIIS